MGRAKHPAPSQHNESFDLSASAYDELPDHIRPDVAELWQIPIARGE
jgi:hypothetical protein